MFYINVFNVFDIKASNIKYKYIYYAQTILKYERYYTQIILKYEKLEYEKFKLR